MNDKDTVVVPELLPCPFCANPHPQAVGSPDGNYVECGSCLATMPPHDPDVPNEIARWNTRFAAAPSTSVREEVEYEVWQDDAFGDGEAMVAGSTDLADAQHYAAVYSQDAPAWVVEVTRRHLRDDATPTDLPPLQDTGEREIIAP